MSMFIEVVGVSKSFSGQARASTVLRDASMSVAHGEFVSVVGAMGTGKSTLLGIIAGLIPADRGEVRIGGEPIRGTRRNTAVVFQNYSLLPWFTALENVRLAVHAAFPELSHGEQRTRSLRALESVGLGAAASRRPGQLSGGMRQRVAIARAIATEPEVLLLDDPFGALDVLTRETLQQELASLGAHIDRPVTTIMITNNLEEAILLSDRVVPLIAGPPATLGDPVPIDLPRPRSVAQLAHDADATHVRGRVVATLTAAIGRSRRPRDPSADVPGPVVLRAIAKEAP